MIPEHPVVAEKWESQLLKEIVLPSLPRRPQLVVDPPLARRRDEPLTDDKAFIALSTSVIISEDVSFAGRLPPAAGSVFMLKLTTCPLSASNQRGDCT